MPISPGTGRPGGRRPRPHGSRATARPPRPCRVGGLTVVTWGGGTAPPRGTATPFTCTPSPPACSASPAPSRTACGRWPVASPEQGPPGRGTSACRLQGPRPPPGTVTYAADGPAFELRGTDSGRLHLTGDLQPIPSRVSPAGASTGGSPSGRPGPPRRSSSGSPRPASRRHPAWRWPRRRGPRRRRRGPRRVRRPPVRPGTGHDVPQALNSARAGATPLARGDHDQLGDEHDEFLAHRRDLGRERLAVRTRLTVQDRPAVRVLGGVR